jgi:hypothetical protein
MLEMDAYQEERVEMRKRFFRGQSRRVFEHPITRISTVRQYLERGYHSERGGVIILSNVAGRTNYGLGIDRLTNELTDFGGKIRPHENSIKGALRELQEETLGIFVTPSIEDIQDCIVVHNDYILVLFIRVSLSPVEICDSFSEALRETLQSGKKTEVSGIMFFTELVFRNLLHRTRHMYSKLAWFLCGAGDFYEHL